MEGNADDVVDCELARKREMDDVGRVIPLASLLSKTGQNRRINVKIYRHRRSPDSLDPLFNNLANYLQAEGEDVSEIMATRPNSCFISPKPHNQQTIHYQTS